MKIKMKLTKPIIFLLILTLIVPTFLVSKVIFTEKKATGAQKQTSKEDRKTAEEISNMTGVKVEEILKLRNEGKTWNEILELLKNKKGTANEADKDKRKEQLAQTGLKTDYIKELEAQGFKNEEITEAKMLVERVVFQLKEILDSNESTTIPVPSIDVGTTTKDEDDLSKYKELSEKIDIDKAVYLMLELQKDFGSMESVLDEYLYSLQIDIDLETYIKDKKAYEKEKAEKSGGINPEDVITVSQIETKMLEKIQEQNTKNNQIGVDPTNSLGTDSKNGTSPDAGNTPQVPLPEAPDTKPADPLADVMQEINDIKNKSLNPGGN